MKEYMLLIRNLSNSKESFTDMLHKEFVGKCEVYIDKLKSQGKLISAQPLIREGKMISGTPGAWKEDNYTQTGEVIVGYYHILANDLEDAVAIAKENPEFAYTTTAKIEVRPIKMKEEITGFIYPKSKN